MDEELKGDYSGSNEPPHVLLVGSGRLARALLRSLSTRFRAILLRDPARTDLAGLAPGAAIFTAFEDIDPALYDTVWIATSDASIETVARDLAGQRPDWGGVTVLHSSGATSPAVLDVLRLRGAATLALHPNGSFTGDAPIPMGCVWGMSGGEHVREQATNLIGPLAPKLAIIQEEFRALYHAAASVAGNYSVTLFAIAADLYRRAGFSADDAREVVAAFIHASAERATALGPRHALTGPIARGDIEVVARQYDALHRYAPEYVDALSELALRTVVLAGAGDVEEWRRAVGKSQKSKVKRQKGESKSPGNSSKS